MENTARALTAQAVIEDFKSIGASELLKVFLVTGATDISKSYEFVKGLLRNATSDAEKASYNNALKALANIELKRITLTSIVYGVDETIPTMPAVAAEATATEATKVILMLPHLDEVLDKVRIALKEANNIEKAKDLAYMELKATIGEGKVMNSEKVVVTWDDDHINQFIDAYVDTITTVHPITEAVVAEETKNYGFKTIIQHIDDMLIADYDERQIKDSIKTVLIGKVITFSEKDQILIKDEKAFEDIYTRLISAFIGKGIMERTAKKETVSKEIQAEKEIETEVIPMLKELDKDEKIFSFASVTKKIRDIYNKLGFNKNLRDSMFQAQEIAVTVAPNLLKRNKEVNKQNIPTVNIADKTIIEPTQNVEMDTKTNLEIYDDTHNIKESDKALWGEIENYTDLQQIFDKSVKLIEKGKWRDALSMCILLISTGKINKDKDSTEKILWDTEQIKQWFNNIVEPSVNPFIEDAIIVVEPTKVDTPVAAPIETIAVKTGTLDPKPKEDVTKLLKDSEQYKGKYPFKSFFVKSDRGPTPTLAFQILDTTAEQEPTLFVTEAGITQFLNGMRLHLVTKRNEQPYVKEQIFKQFSLHYDITGSNVKGMISVLVNEADAIRRANRDAIKAPKAVEPTKVDTPIVEVPTVVPPIVTPPVVEVPVVTPPVVVEPTVDVPGKEVVASPPEVKPVEEQGLPETITPTEVPSGVEHINTNDNPSVVVEEPIHDEFKDILTARTKLELHKAIFTKVDEFEDERAGIETVFNVINVARRDKRYKNSQLANWKPTPLADLLNNIKRIVEKGHELVNKPVLIM